MIRFDSIPGLNSRWHSLDHDVLAHQNTPALQAMLQATQCWQPDKASGH